VGSTLDSINNRYSLSLFYTDKDGILKTGLAKIK
jgi:hypothetical protein